MTCSEITYVKEQGIFSGITGNLFGIQGIFWSETRNFEGLRSGASSKKKSMGDSARRAHVTCCGFEPPRSGPGRDESLGGKEDKISAMTPIGL